MLDIFQTVAMRSLVIFEYAKVFLIKPNIYRSNREREN